MTDATPAAASGGYIDFCAILGVPEDARPGDVRNVYKRTMRDLVREIGQSKLTEAKRGHFLLEMAKLNAALYVLRDRELREAYQGARARLIELERDWAEAEAQGGADADALRQEYDRLLRDFLSRFVEELMLVAGTDKECVEASGWDAAHARHAAPLLRRFRHRLQLEILQRLPYFEVTAPQVDWAERDAWVARTLAGGTR